MEPEDILDWKAFHALEPFGCQIEDYRFGVLASAVGGMHPLYDYFPGYHQCDLKVRPLPDLTPEELDAKITASFAKYKKG